jgi:hypothetical protein
MCQAQHEQHRSQQRAVERRLGAEGLRGWRAAAHAVDDVRPVTRPCGGIGGIESPGGWFDVGVVELVRRWRCGRLGLAVDVDDVIEIRRGVTAFVIRILRWGNGHFTINSCAHCRPSGVRRLEVFAPAQPRPGWRVAAKLRVPRPPAGLELLDALIEVCDGVRKALEVRLTANTRAAVSLPALPDGARLADFLAKLGAATTAAEIGAACVFTDAHAEELERSLAEESRLRTSDATQEKARLLKLAVAADAVAGVRWAASPPPATTPRWSRSGRCCRRTC